LKQHVFCTALVLWQLNCGFGQSGGLPASTVRYDGINATWAEPSANLAIERNEGMVFCGIVSDKARALPSSLSRADIDAFCTRSATAPERPEREVIVWLLFGHGRGRTAACRAVMETDGEADGWRVMSDAETGSLSSWRVVHRGAVPMQGRGLGSSGACDLARKLRHSL